MPFLLGLSLFLEQPARAADCLPGLDAASAYTKLKQKTFSHNSYTAVYRHETYRGNRRQIYSRQRTSGRYLQEPAVYCLKRLAIEASFPEQAGAGYQECYRGKDDLTYLLMPGALRLVGVIKMFPEDPKSDYLNGENSKTGGVWTWFQKWDRMAKGGTMDLSCVNYHNRVVPVVTIETREPDPVYAHYRVRIFIDPETWFPVRTETFAQGIDEPVAIFEFEEVKLDAPLTDKDMEFEGLSLNTNLSSLSIPEGPHLKDLKPWEPKLEKEEAGGSNPFLSRVDQGLAKLKDYRTEMTVELRYFRLRQIQNLRFLYSADKGVFRAETVSLEANYIILAGGEGSRMIYDPSRDALVHLLPAGIFKVTGEQAMARDDPRIFTSMGDNLTDLNFFSLRDILKKRLNRPGRIRTAMATYSDPPGYWIEVAEKGDPVPKRPGTMRILLDPETNLPVILEYLGYDDPQGFVRVRFTNTKINAGIATEELWK